MSLQYSHVVEFTFGACVNPVHGVQVPFVPAVPFGQLEHFILPSMNVVIPGEHLSHLDWPAWVVTRPRGHGANELHPFVAFLIIHFEGWLPGGILRHLMLLFEYFPASHNLHKVAIAFFGWYFPGEHISHEALPYFFVALPAKHGKHEAYEESFSAKYLPGWHGKHCRP